MSPSKSHPHIDRPTEAQLLVLVEHRPPAVRELYLAVHSLVLEALPDVAYSADCDDGEIGYGARQYGYDGWGMAALAPYAKWVSLAFLSATSLDDAAGLLEGTGNTIRHVKVRSIDQLAEIREALRALVEAASRLNQG